MKKILVGLFLSLSFLVAANIQITARNAKNELVTVEVPQNPQRIAIADMAALDILDFLGEGDKVVASVGVNIPYLSKYKDKGIKIGTVKEISYENLLKAKPDVIFIGGRLAKEQEKLAKIAPVVNLGLDYANGAFKSTEFNALEVAKIFKKEDLVKAKFDEYKKRLNAINSASKGKTAMLTLVTNSHVNILGDAKRCAMITTDAGFKNLSNDSKSEHGNEANFELFAKLNPDYIFVLDRDSAIGAKGAKLASQILNNDIVNSTKAHKNGNIIYLSAVVWYISEGGVNAMDIMLSDLEKALKIK